MTMKRLMLVLCAAAALQGMAQEPFTVKPAPFKKYVRLNRGVNLRQQPTTQSARLIWDDSEESAELAWRKGQLRPGEQLVEADVLPVWEERGDWYQAQYGEKTVFVMKKFCKDVELRPIDNIGENEAAHTFTSGRYTGYCISMSYISGGCQIMIGKRTDGMFVFRYAAECRVGNEDVTTVDAEGNVVFCKLLADNDGDPSLYKIVDDSKTIDVLMDNVNKMKQFSLYLFGVVRNTDIYSAYAEKTE